jgi:hypothetical protein
MSCIIPRREEAPARPAGHDVIAYGGEERRRQAAQYGAADFFTKPVDFEPLKAHLEQSPSTTELGAGSNDRLSVFFDQSSDPGDFGARRSVSVRHA